MIRGKLLRPGSDISQALHVRDAALRARAGLQRRAGARRDRPHQLARAGLRPGGRIGEPAGDACGTAASGGRTAEFHLGRIAVLREKRGQGLGDLLMRMLLFKAREHGARSVALSAQLQAVPFYARYGFVPFGEQILDEGVPHQRMRVMGDQINLEGTCCKRGAQDQR